METIVGRTLKASTKSVLVDEEALTISYRALYHGFEGDKRIPYSSITAVQFKEPGSWLAGYIQFSIKGAREWHGPVNQDENSLQFDSPVAADFRALRDFVQAKTEAKPAAAPLSAADELSKLAALRDQGVLTDAEFAAEKVKVLSRG
jgi:hypothetical protein